MSKADDRVKTTNNSTNMSVDDLINPISDFFFFLLRKDWRGRMGVSMEGWGCWVYKEKMDEILGLNTMKVND